MSFRDDHDAAVARIDSLEAELKTERAAAQVLREQLEVERAERRRFQAIAGSQRPIEDSGPAILRTVVALVLVIAIIAIYRYVQ